MQGNGNPGLEEGYFARVGGRKREAGGEQGARLIPEEFMLDSWGIGGGPTGLAARRKPEAVIKKEGRSSSDCLVCTIGPTWRTQSGCHRCWSAGPGSSRDSRERGLFGAGTGD